MYEGTPPNIALTQVLHRGRLLNELINLSRHGKRSVLTEITTCQLILNTINNGHGLGIQHFRLVIGSIYARLSKLSQCGSSAYRYQ